jgi:hypothetical protein
MKRIVADILVSSKTLLALFALAVVRGDSENVMAGFVPAIHAVGE